MLTVKLPLPQRIRQEASEIVEVSDRLFVDFGNHRTHLDARPVSETIADDVHDSDSLGRSEVQLLADILGHRLNNRAQLLFQPFR